MAIILSGPHILTGNFIFRANEPSAIVFSSYTFTNVGQTGPTGPTLTQAKTAYAGNGQFDENDTNAFNVTNGYQSFVVPTTGTYRFTVKGASGGVWTTSPADAATAALMPTIDGYVRMPGASLVGDYALTAGQVITFVVGHGGGDDTNTVANCPGGGGGTFVTLGDYASVVAATDTLLFAAGGGGGCGYQSLDSVATGATAFNVGRGQSGTGGATSGGAPGTSGSGGTASGGGNSTAGGGYLSGAGSSVTQNFGGAPDASTGISRGFRQGAVGGAIQTTAPFTRGWGGFGGGGNGASTTGSDDDKGGGGGYSGGGYAFDSVLAGGGGGSFASGSATNVTITAGGNTTGRHGSVTIQLL